MSMHNPYLRTTPAASSSTAGGAPASSPQAAYDSFIDIDGFPAAGSSFASSPSHSTATTSINIDRSSDVRKLDPTSAVKMDSARGWAGMPSSQVDWPAEDQSAASPVDWPAGSAQPTLFDMKQNQRQQQHLQPGRDQQIFRRKLSTSGSASARSFSSSRGSSEDKKSPQSGGRGSIVFESFEASTSNNNLSPSRDSGRSRPTNSSTSSSASHSRDFGSNRSGGTNDQSQRSASLLDSVAEAARNNVSSAPPSLSTGGNRQNIPQNGSTSRSFGNGTSPMASSTSKKSLPSPPPPPDTTVSISPQSVIRKPLNKLVSLFGNKQQQQNGQQTSPSSKLEAANNGLQQLKQTLTAGVQSAGVQFKQSPPNQTSHQSNRAHASTYSPSNNHPAISPSRSNAQSSVTGYSGDSSSYNPTGWPGTVDKRGRTYAMEPSYSESEGESLASPQRRIRASGNAQQQGQYPVQNYRGNEEGKQQFGGEAFSFGGGASAVAGAAELEDWLKGDDVDDDYTDFGEHSKADNVGRSSGPIDLDSCYSANQTGESRHASERKSGPVDLDEAYKRRFDGWDNNNNKKGWRDGHEQSLANISETRTAADVQLEAALGMSNVARQKTPNKSMDKSVPGSYSQSVSPNNAMPAEEAKLQGIDLSGSEERIRSWGRGLPSPKFYSDEVELDQSAPINPNSYNNTSYSRQRMEQQQQTQQGGLQTLSEEALRLKDAHSAPPRPGGAMSFRGYRGFMDKTKDVPNLMDDLESEASTSLGTGIYSTNGRRQHGNMGLTLPAATARNNGNNGNVGRPASLVSSSNVDSGSDVFDGLQEEPFGPMEKDILNVNAEEVSQQRGMMWKNESKHLAPQNFARFEGENLPYSTKFNPFAAGQASDANRFDGSLGAKADLMDPSLNISAVSRGSAGDYSHELDGMDQIEDDFESLPDLSIYSVDPEMVRQMVRAFRKICTNQMEISSSEETMLYDFENLVDTKKAFALFEMRSRIMETDIDRGLERRGGTSIVDDIVTTPYFQAAARVRDAVIVSKAWRDGATPKDVTTAHLLTRRSAKAHFVRRPIHRIRRPGKPFFNQGPQYWLEEVNWLDDTDFMLMRCQSLGAGAMKGFEMFTVGDCQSILLKMTSDNCTQLRRELRSAMMRQIEAEELMNEEIDMDGDENIVAEAEQLYRDATVEVKTLSIKLVLADKAFALVRNRMEQLVETIESLLLDSVHSDEGSEDDSHSHESDGSSYVSQESEQDKVKLVVRAKRAELSAEVAVREALLAKQEAEQIRSTKQREIESLKEKLADMETKSQLMANEQRMVYLNGTRAKTPFDKWEAKSFLESTFDKDDGAEKKHRLKQKFRERRLSKPKEEGVIQTNQNEWLA